MERGKRNQQWSEAQGWDCGCSSILQLLPSVTVWKQNDNWQCRYCQLRGESACVGYYLSQRFCSISYELLQYWERLLTSGTTPVDLRRENMENEACLAPDFLNIGRSTQKMACWTPRDKKLYVEQYVSGHEGLFLIHGVRIHTNHLQRRTQSRKWMHVFTLEVYMWIRFYWIKAFFFLCMCTWTHFHTLQHCAQKDFIEP